MTRPPAGPGANGQPPGPNANGQLAAQPAGKFAPVDRGGFYPDPATGRRYRVNPTTGASEWVDPPLPGPGYSPYLPRPEHQSAPKPARAWLPVTALALSAVSLVGVIVLAAIVLTRGASAAPVSSSATAPTDSSSAAPSDGPGGSTMTGVLPHDPKGFITGDNLTAVVTNRIAQDGGDVNELTCPDSSVQQGVFAVCHGKIDGDTWAIVVFFEDSAGDYTLSPV